MIWFTNLQTCSFSGFVKFGLFINKVNTQCRSGKTIGFVFKHDVNTRLHYLIPLQRKLQRRTFFYFLEDACFLRGEHLNYVPSAFRSCVYECACVYTAKSEDVSFHCVHFVL